MRIAILTHYWAPEVGAPQTRLGETARELMRLGDEVRIITNHPHYPDGKVRPSYNGLSIRRESSSGVQVLRLPVLARPNTGFLNRVVDQASFAVAAAAAVGDVRWADVLVVESPPLFLGLTARWLGAVARRPYVFHVADPWPDYPIEIGAIRGAAPIWLARWIERVSYAGAAAITTPTSGCAAMIANRAPAGIVRVIPNAVDTRRFDPSMSAAEARRQLGWDPEPFTFVYAGTVGLAQGLGTLLEAAELLSNQASAREFAITIVGDGAERGELEARARDLPSVRFVAPRPSSDIPIVLAAADAALVLLRQGPLAGAALPTKLVEALAAGRPVVVSADGDARSLVEEADAGWSSRAEDARGLAEAMAQAMDGDRLGDRAINARALALDMFDRRNVVKKLRAVVMDAAAAGKARSTEDGREGLDQPGPLF